MRRKTERHCVRASAATHALTPLGRPVRHGLKALSAAATLGLVFLVAPVVLVGSAGCGTDLQTVLYQSATAAGRTWLDLALTDVANALAERCEEQDTPSADDDGGDEDSNDGGDVIDDGDEGNNGDGVNGGGGFEGLTGEPAAGEPLYASCTACHCADASGGCLPGATGLVGVSAETLDEFLRGDAAHPSSNLSDQEIVDLQAYLASLGG